jgi:hypothetical protein
MVIGDKEKSRKLIASDEEYQENVRQMQAAASPEQPATTQADQAAAGHQGRNQ